MGIHWQREKGFDCLAGMRNIMTEVIENPYNVTAEQLVELSEQLDDYMGRREGYIKKFGTVEYPEMISLKYIFDYYGLKFSTSLEENRIYVLGGLYRIRRICRYYTYVKKIAGE